MVITAAIEIFGSPFFGSASKQHCQGSHCDRDPLDREPDGHIHGVRATGTEKTATTDGSDPVNCRCTIWPRLFTYTHTGP